MKKLVLFAAIFLLIASSTASFAIVKSNTDYVKADIFYIRWDILTRAALSFDDLRNKYFTKTTIVDEYEIAQFVKWLEINKMELTDGNYEDPRLLIDLYDSTGKRTTYYASRFSLCSEDSKMKREINSKFRKKFHF